MTDPILFVSYSGAFGGAERVLLDCVTRLERPLRVACPPGPLADRLTEANVAHEPIPVRPLELGLAHAAGVAGLARDIRRLKAPFVVAWGARAVLAAALEHTPWLAVHHDLLQQPTRAVVKAATRYAERTLSISDAIAKQFGGGVLHPGVDLTAFTPRPLPPGPPRALVLGALVEWKRPQFALEVAAVLPDLHLTVAGAILPGDDGRVEAELRAGAEIVGERVTIAGPVENVDRVLAEHHLLLHCAPAEPYGMVLVEALAAGRPVVAPDSAGPREIVAGGAGRLYPPGDLEAAVEAVEEVLADAQAPAAARSRAEARFDVRDSVARLEAALP